MALSTDQIFYYAAAPNDYSNAQSVASDFSIGKAHVLGSFALAYAAVKAGKALVIAVGAPAANALKYNDCAWDHYGATNFTYLDNPVDTLPGEGVFMNANGATAADSEQLAHNFTYYASNGTCSSTTCPSAAQNAPADSCVGYNPTCQNDPAFCCTAFDTKNDTCLTSDCKAIMSTCDEYCSGSEAPICNASDSIETIALDSGWDPITIAQSTLMVMENTGVDISGLDRFMAMAAMEKQGCYNAPNSCFGHSGGAFSAKCSTPVADEGYGVLQETYQAGKCSSFCHQPIAFSQAGKTGSIVQQAFFPTGDSNTSTTVAGYVACALVRDPGYAFAVFDFWALEYMQATSASACETLGTYIGGPTTAVESAECEYALATNTASCTSATCPAPSAPCTSIY